MRLPYICLLILSLAVASPCPSYVAMCDFICIRLLTMSPEALHVGIHVGIFVHVMHSVQEERVTMFSSGIFSKI